MGHRSPRVILIDRPFQLRMAGEFVLLQLFLTALFAGGLYVFLSSEVQAGLYSAHASYRSLAHLLMPIVCALSIFNVALSTVLVTLFVLHLSRRLARPLLGIRAVLEELARRRFLDHTGIRPGDQLWKVDQSLTSAVATVQADFQALRQVTLELRQVVDAGQAPAVLGQLERLEQLLKPWSRG